MTYRMTSDCTSGLHEYCTLCECECHNLPICNCVVKNRENGETEREWFKRWMCQFHWMQTNYYQRKLDKEVRTWDLEK